MLIHCEQLVRIEKGLLAMRALTGTCRFSAESARLKELISWLENYSVGPDGVDIEYVNSLLERCRSLLRSIRSQNLDL